MKKDALNASANLLDSLPSEEPSKQQPLINPNLAQFASLIRQAAQMHHAAEKAKRMSCKPAGAQEL